MGRRALARAVASAGGRAAFCAELFAEAAGYYVSRDLPSYLGGTGRVSTAADAIAVKESFRAIARDAARTAAGGESPPTDAQGWRAYVERVISGLAARKGAS